MDWRSKSTSLRQWMGGSKSTWTPMDRRTTLKRDRLILEIREDIRALDRPVLAREIDQRFPSKDPTLFGAWSKAQDAEHRRKTILYVLRREDRPSAAKRGREREAVDAPAPPPAPGPPLVWPCGMRQRREGQPTFKLPFLYSKSDGSERVFLRGLGDGTLTSVGVRLQGRNAGYAPGLRPGEFVEVEWKLVEEVERIATWGGWRDDILAFESNKEAASMARSMANQPQYSLMAPLADLSDRIVARVAPHVPANIDAWKTKVHRFAVRVDYTYRDGGVTGFLEGYMDWTMERHWFRFTDKQGHSTPLV